GVLTRALALQPERGRERPRLLAAGASLLLAARRLAGAPPASLVMTLADLRLDRLAGEGERAAEVEAARQDAEASARDAREAHGTPTPGQPALSRWGLARARALAGDEEGAAAALAEAGRLLEQDPVLVVPFRAWVARDPWLGELRRRPR